MIQHAVTASFILLAQKINQFVMFYLFVKDHTVIFFLTGNLYFFKPQVSVIFVGLIPYLSVIVCFTDCK